MNFHACKDLCAKTGQSGKSRKKSGSSEKRTNKKGQVQKGLEVCYCLWGCHPDPRLGPILGPSRSHPGSEVVPSRFAMCFVLQCFGPIQVPRWGPSRPVLVPSCSRAFLPGSGLDGQKQTSWPLPISPDWEAPRFVTARVSQKTRSP